MREIRVFLHRTIATAQYENEKFELETSIEIDSKNMVEKSIDEYNRLTEIANRIELGIRERKEG